LDGQTVAFDGKSLTGSHDKSRGKPALHSVSAWVCGLRMCIGLKSVDDKSNEIPAVQELIDLIDRKGAVVTADAMHCQTETAKAIIDKEADYILMVKGNQPTLQDALHDAIINAMEKDDPKVRRNFKKEINRGRLETREVIVQPVPKDLAVFSSRAGIKSIGVIHRTREVNGKLEEEIETFIGSREPKVRDIAQRIREH
jgi:predicted transposase YbfD/YdcC